MFGSQVAVCPFYAQSQVDGFSRLVVFFVVQHKFLDGIYLLVQGVHSFVGDRVDVLSAMQLYFLLKIFPVHVESALRKSRIPIIVIDDFTPFLCMQREVAVKPVVIVNIAFQGNVLHGPITLDGGTIFMGGDDHHRLCFRNVGHVPHHAPLHHALDMLIPQGVSLRVHQPDYHSVSAGIVGRGYGDVERLVLSGPVGGEVVDGVHAFPHVVCQDGFLGGDVFHDEISVQGRVGPAAALHLQLHGAFRDGLDAYCQQAAQVLEAQDAFSVGQSQHGAVIGVVGGCRFLAFGQGAGEAGHIACHAAEGEGDGGRFAFHEHAYLVVLGPGDASVFSYLGAGVCPGVFYLDFQYMGLVGGDVLCQFVVGTAGPEHQAA